MSKKLLFGLGCFLFAMQLSAQEVGKNDQAKAQETVSDDNSIYNTSGIEIKPEYPGGIEAFYKLISKNYNMPKIKNLAGKVFVTFVVEKDGSLTEIKVLRDIGFGTGEEAIRVLKLSEKWKPGEQNGKKVRTQYGLPISLSN